MSAMEVREAADADRAAIGDVLRAAFAREDESRLVDALRADKALALEFVALVDGALVGYCAFSPVTIAPSIEGEALGIAPVDVAPTHQRKGIGAALVETGSGIAKMRGANLIVVLGEPKYYSRFGFVPAASRNIAWAARDAGKAFQILDFARLSRKTARLVHYHRAFSG